MFFLNRYTFDIKAWNKNIKMTGIRRNEILRMPFFQFNHLQENGCEMEVIAYLTNTVEVRVELKKKEFIFLDYDNFRFKM